MGFLLMLAALMYGIYFAGIEPMLPNHAFGPGNITNILFAVGGLVAGLLLVAVGECIGVLFAIEANTRMAAINSRPPNPTPQPK